MKDRFEPKSKFNVSIQEKVKEACKRVNEHLSEQDKCPKGATIDFLDYHKKIECQFSCYFGKKIQSHTPQNIQQKTTVSRMDDNWNLSLFNMVEAG